MQLRPPRAESRNVLQGPYYKDDATIICFSHLRWDFVYQRPQHLLSRFSKKQSVIYFEEPQHAEGASPTLSLRHCEQSGVVIATPQFPHGTDLGAQTTVLRSLLDGLLAELRCGPPVLWFYTPMMFAFASHLEAAVVVYDCMDELSNFNFAPPDLPKLEQALMARADVVFTGGIGLYEAKRDSHPNIHAFPSSVDLDHFAQARRPAADPADQCALPGPRLGYYGVIDERMDLGLLARLAASHPEWSIVMIGPVVKIDPDTLPRLPNIHYLGSRSYAELPRYLGGWDVALMPFAINDATRFISPTKTPEYLAGGRSVVSTPIRDVVLQYGQVGAVRIAQTGEEFVAACEAAITERRQGDTWLDPVDALLTTMSWDKTHAMMAGLVAEAIVARAGSPRTEPARTPRRRAGATADVLVVGAGFAGSVMAERIAAESGKRVLVIDRRSHVGGNAYDHRDAAGLLVHRYGPHIFHTNSDEVAAYLSRFTNWRAYEHRVLASVSGMMVPMPINRTTINSLYGLSLASDDAAAAFLAEKAETRPSIVTSEDVVVAKVGRDLYERFFRGYTRKQWGMDPSELDKSVAGRVPARTNTDDRYFTDSFQAMPLDGYTRMFEAMLNHPLIEVRTGTDFADIDPDAFEHVVFTGPIDEYFGFRFGKLPYRSLRFDHVTLDREAFQAVGTVNYPDERIPYTRITEFKHLSGQHSPKTSIVYEYPCAEGDPYYPVPRPENQALFKRYEALARDLKTVSFVGRLATYRYYNMDQVVGQALSAYRTLAKRWHKPSRSSTDHAEVAVAND